MTILVCGGAGYIGSHINKQLHKEGYDTIIFNNLVYGHREAVKWGEFVQGDLAERSALEKVFEKYDIDAVFHFAAFAYVGESVIDPEKYYFNNVANTLNLLSTMKKYKCRKIIFSSTCATYGIPDNLPITEDMPETHIIPLILDAASGKREDVKIFGTDYDTPDGSCIRDYIHVSDLAMAHVLALHYLEQGKESDCFNLGNTVGTSVFELVEAVKRVTERNFQVSIAERRAGDPAKLVGSSEKAKRILGWKPVYSHIDTIVRHAWKWHRNALY